MHLAGRDLVTRMRRQSRVEDGLQRGMAAEMGGDSQCAVGRAVHPQEQSAHAPLQQPGLERAEHGAGVAPPGTDPLPERVAAGGQHRAGQHVAVAVQVLGGRVHHQVRAELQRPGQHRCRHRVVDRDPYPGGVGQLADGREVGDLPHRVGRCLRPQQPGTARPDRGLHGGQVGGVGELHVQAPGEAELGQPLPHPPVQDPGDQHVIAGEQRLEDRGGCGHARGEQRARAARPLQRGQQPLGVLEGRVVGPGVDAVLVVGAVGLLLIVRRRVDDRGQAAGHRVHLAQGLRRQGLG